MDVNTISLWLFWDRIDNYLISNWVKYNDWPEVISGRIYSDLCPVLVDRVEWSDLVSLPGTIIMVIISFSQVLAG